MAGLPKRICVAICTRQRPKMLLTATQSVIDTTRFSGSEVCILIVENEAAPQFSAQSLKSALKGNDECGSVIPVAHRHCPKIGIASARNVALDFARGDSFDYLAFIDDDEVVAQDWLAQLVSAADDQGLVLTGGPVTPVLESNPETYLQQAVWAGYWRQRKRRRDYAQRSVRAGKAGRAVVITSNWLLDLRSATASDLRFDEQFDQMGGEDTDFFRRLKARNGPTGWAPKAHVFETIPVSRLSVRYQLARHYRQSCVKMRAKTAGRALPFKLLTAAPEAGLHLGLGIAFLIAALPSFGWTLFDAVRHIGSGVGVMAAFGQRPLRGYQTVTGH